MLEINNKKLVPGIVATWGDITGNVENQEDLVEYITNEALSGYATESWVSNQGYLTSIPSEYATQSWVTGQSYITSEALSGYATESWVSAQGYLTSETIPSDIATQSWVESQNFATESWVSAQGYLTSETLPSDLATESWVESQGYITTSALSGYATESWVSAQGFLSADDPSIAPLIAEITKYSANATIWENEGERLNIYEDQGVNRGVFNIGGEIYLWRSNLSNKIYKFNKSTYQFEYYAYANWDGWVTNSPCILWEDNNGCVFALNGSELYWVDMSEGHWNVNDNSWMLYGLTISFEESNNSVNLVNLGEDGIYLCDNLGQAYPYVHSENPGAPGYFEENNPITFSNGGDSDWFKKINYYEGHCVYVNNNVMYDLVYTSGTSLVFTQLSAPLYPVLNSTLPNARFVNLVDDYYVYINLPYVYKLENGSWVDLNVNVTGSPDLSSADGGTVWGDGEMLLGWAYYNLDYTPYLLVTNLGTTKSVNIIEDSLSNIELNYAQKSWVENNYASQRWVYDRGYISYEAMTEYVQVCDFAPKYDLFYNTITLPYGPNVNPWVQLPYGDTFRYVWTTPSGRLFCRDYNYGGSGDVELVDNGNGPELQSITLSVWIDPNTGYFYKTSTHLFYITSFGTYLWNESNSDFSQIADAPSLYDYDNILITTDDTIRCSDGTKLVENGGTWSWVADAMVDTFRVGRSILVGSTVYVYDNAETIFYTYDESTKTYTYSIFCDAGPCDTGNIFTFGGDLFYTCQNGLVVKPHPQEGWCEPVNIPNSNQGQSFYGSWNGISNMVLTDSGQLGYCFASYTEIPRPPYTDGVYVFQATVSNGNITYEWVTNEVQQAVQITNEILG